MAERPQFFWPLPKGLISGARAGKKARTILFGGATWVVSTALTVLVLQLVFGPLLPLTHRPLTEMAAAVCVMA